MESKSISLELPTRIYDELKILAEHEQVNPTEMVVRLVQEARERAQTVSPTDPVLDLIGAYKSHQPLIDNISVSEDPDLYLVAETLGDEAKDMPAWDIAPARYIKRKM